MISAGWFFFQMWAIIAGLAGILLLCAYIVAKIIGISFSGFD